MVIQYLPALFLIVVAPIWDHFATERLKASKESRVKIAYCRTMVIVSWMTSVIALVAVGRRTILTFNLGAAGPSWLPERAGARTFGAGVLIVLLLAIALSALQARRSAPSRRKWKRPSFA